MKLSAIKVSEPIRYGDSLFSLIDKNIATVSENTILAITSKVISLCEKAAYAYENKEQVDKIILKEADAVLDEKGLYNIHLTIKNHHMIPSAGVDVSNGGGYITVYPQNPQKSAKKIWQYIKNRDQVKNFGVIITDSRTSPMRAGVTGMCIGWCGFEPLYNYIGKEDIFGKTLEVARTNILDALATSAVFLMGEGNEQSPIALIEDAPKIQFLQRSPSKEEEKSVRLSLKEDLYGPLLNAGNWIFS